MFRIGQAALRHCQGLSRREMLRVGGLSALGITLADWFRIRESQAGPFAQNGSPGRDPSCIFLFLSGGPSHLETFDPKPNTPDTVRGPYGAIRTNVTCDGGVGRIVALTDIKHRPDGAATGIEQTGLG